MRCPDENVIMEFLHGQLPAAAAHELESHVDRCRDCATLLSELARMGSSAPPPGSLPRPGAIADGYRAPPALVGQEVGRYVVEQQIGAGAMGVVYAALDPTLGRRIALKLLPPEAAASPEEHRDAAARMLREARAMAALSHPNVVPVFDAGALGDQVYLAMELVDGQTLVDWLRAAKRSWRQILDAWEAAGRGLAAAHEAGVLHRDFKPANVLVGHDGRVRVTDFGLARFRDAPGLPGSPGPAGAPSPPPAGSPPLLATAAGAVVGTPAYMAPEQIFSQPIDARADQFAFCASLYEALYGASPFGGQNLLERRWHYASGAARRPPNHNGVPRAIASVLGRGLSIRAEDRFPSMNALLAELVAARRSAGEVHLTINAICQIAAWPFHIVFVIFWIRAMATPDGVSSSPMAAARGEGGDGSVLLGFVVVVVLLAFLSWMLLGVVWAPLNALGLTRRWSFARRSTMLYGAFAIASCIGLPYGVYALWSLRSVSVREALRKG